MSDSVEKKENDSVEKKAKESLEKEAKLNLAKEANNLKRKTPFPPFSVLHLYGYSKWKLCARIEQKFNVQHYLSRKRMKFLLVDAQGIKLKASMFDGEVDRLKDLVEEGKIYSFTAVDIKNAPSQYKLVESDIECMFSKETEIEEQDDDTIPKFSFKFVTFDELYAFKDSKCLLIVIGTCIDFSPAWLI